MRRVLVRRRDALKGILSSAIAFGVDAREAAVGERLSPIPVTGKVRSNPIPQQVPVSAGVLQRGAGAGLYFWDTGGSGPVVVLAHPGSGSALIWPYQQPALAQAGYRVIAYSRRGHYLSPAGNATDSGTYADDLNALIEHIGIDRFHLVGVAAGGFTAVDYAISFPSRVRSLTIACSQLGMWDPEVSADLKRVLTAGFLDFPLDFQELGASYRALSPDGVQLWLQLAAMSREGTSRVRQTAKTAATWEKLRAVPARKLLITGGADLIQPPALMHLAAQRMGDCESAVIPEAGHAVHWEAPQSFNSLLIDFLRRSG